MLPPIFYNIFPKTSGVYDSINLLKYNNSKSVQNVRKKIESNCKEWNDYLILNLNGNLDIKTCILLLKYAENLPNKYGKNNYFGYVLRFSILQSLTAILSNNKFSKLPLKESLDSILIVNYQCFDAKKLSKKNYNLLINRLENFKENNEIADYIHNNLIDYSEIDTTGMPIDLQRKIGKEEFHTGIHIDKAYSEVFDKVNRISYLYPDMNYVETYKELRTNRLMLEYDKWAFLDYCLYYAQVKNDKNILNLLYKILQNINTTDVDIKNKKYLLENINRCLKNE